MPVRDAGRRRGCYLSLSLLWAVRSRPPRHITGVSRRRELDNLPEPGSAPGPVRPLSFSCFPMPGADGRTGADQPVDLRSVQGPHSGCTAREAGIVARAALQGRIRSKPPIKFWHPGTDGAAAGGIPLPGATGLCCRVVNALAHSPPCFPARKPEENAARQRWPHPHRVRTWWQSGSQLRLAGRTDGPRKEKEGGVYGSTKAHPKANQLHPLRRRAAAPAENLLLCLQAEKKQR